MFSSFDLIKVKKFLKPTLQEKWPLFWGLIRSLFFGLQGGGYAIAMKLAVDSVVEGNEIMFLYGVGIMAVLMLLSTLPNYFFRNMNNLYFRGLQKYFYNIYIDKYFQLENNLTDSKGTGYFNNIIQRGGDNWASLLSTINGSGLQVIIRIIVAIGLFMTYTGWIGTILVLFVFIISFVIAQYGNKKMIPLRKEMRDFFTQADKDIVRLIMSKFEVLANGRIGFELKKLDVIFDNILVRRYRESFIRIFTFDVQKLSINIMQILLLLYVGYGVLNGQYEVGLLAMVWMLSNQINGSVQDLNDYITDFYSRITYVEKLRETFDDAPLIQGYDTGKEFIYKRGDIVLDTVTYDYGKGEVLKDFSLSIQGGKKTALVGISGSGKSTLMKLIAGYIHPQFGTISVDKQELPNGQNTHFISLKSYYQHIGYLTQEPSVFDGSIYDNLLYALNYEPNDKKIQQVLSDAQCQFVLDFPDGLGSQIGEKGIRLSGGQRQRLAIAKIMLKNPNIILLDEPTSALDSFSEEEVTKAFDNLAKGKTVIIIAHRLQTVKQADTILVLDQGKIIEQGNHIELVKKKGSYAKMLELQSGF
ncbi:Multidrug resistance ABC transporter ATP-binding/permease protein BmrA [candidate division SR1 bacterium Aalborg_AAW-1]|nr:Multidrug resistance ABC transporter ATP-binding/permease protein BmrA [candidate division SR1 bacterium Aalborg_AAW-1]